MSDRVERIECFVLTLPRKEAYLGALGPGETPNAKGYFVRGRNGTVYPTFDRSVLVRARTNSGAVGLGRDLRHRGAGGTGVDYRGPAGRLRDRPRPPSTRPRSTTSSMT